MRIDRRVYLLAERDATGVGGRQQHLIKGDGRFPESRLTCNFSLFANPVKTMSTEAAESCVLASGEKIKVVDGKLKNNANNDF